MQKCVNNAYYVHRAIMIVSLHKQGRLWCQLLMFAYLWNGLYAIIHSNITITIFLHFSYTQNNKCDHDLFAHHKQGRLWCQPLMFTCHQNGLYAIITHSNITITIFLHFSYTQIPRIINVNDTFYLFQSLRITCLAVPCLNFIV